MNSQENNKRIAKNSILLSFRMIVTLAISLYTTKIVLNGLGINDYGIYNVVCGLVSMFSFLSNSMASGIQRFYNFELSKDGIIGAQKVYNSALIIQISLIILLVILCEIGGLIYIDNKMVIPIDRIETAKSIFHMSIISFALSILQVPYLASIMAHEKMDYFAFITILDSIFKLLIAFSISMYFNDRLWLYGFLMMILSLFDLLAYYIYTKIKFSNEIRISRHIDYNILKSMLSFSGWNTIGQLGGLLREQGINLLLNLFFGVAINSARGIAIQVSGGLNSLVSNINVAIRPQIVQAYAQNNIERMFKLMYSLSKMSFLLFYIISLPIILESKFILNVWLDNNVPQYTSVFIIFIILINFVNLLNAATSAVVHATGKMALYQITGFFMTILILPVSYLGLKMGGSPVIPFITYFIFIILMQTVITFILNKIVKFSVKEYFREVLIPIILVIFLSIVFPIIPNKLMEESFTRFVVTVTTSLISGGSITFFIGLNKQEQNILKSYFISFYNKIKN